MYSKKVSDYYKQSISSNMMLTWITSNSENEGELLHSDQRFMETNSAISVRRVGLCAKQNNIEQSGPSSTALSQSFLYFFLYLHKANRTMMRSIEGKTGVI